jgi:hypothetical protein
MPTVDVTVREESDGWTALVTVRSQSTTAHKVRISRADHVRYGDGDVADLVRRSFEFLLAREPNTSILREFALPDIERYFAEYGKAITGR